MANFYIKCDYNQLLINYKKGATTFYRLWALSDDIMRIWITAYRKQLAPHQRTSELALSMGGSYEVDVNEPLRMFTIKLLRVSDLPPYWAMLNWGSANTNAAYFYDFLIHTNPQTGQKGRLIPGDRGTGAKGTPMEYKPGEKNTENPMWVTHQIKGINWIKYGDDEAIAKVEQLFLELGVI